MHCKLQNLATGFSQMRELDVTCNDGFGQIFIAAGVQVLKLLQFYCNS